MRGWIVSKHEKTFAEAIDKLEYRLLDKVQVGGTEVRIKVFASALNFFDLLAMVNRYQIQYTCPFSPCSEASGVVLQVGSNSKYRVGDQVLVVFGGNTAREELVIEDKFVFPKPSRLSHHEAAAVFVGYATAYHALFQRGKLNKNETVLVTGAAGGMGTLAIAIAKEHGARVIGTVSTELKKKTVLALGADDCIVLSSDPTLWVKQLKQAAPAGFDVVYEVCVSFFPQFIVKDRKRKNEREREREWESLISISPCKRCQIVKHSVIIALLRSKNN